MALDGHVDVVVVGFGVAGAAAALAAAHAGARVLVLDGAPLAEPWLHAPRAVRAAVLLRSGLRAAVREAGVDIRAQHRAHELVVAAGEVCGLGYAALPRRSAATVGHRWLHGLGKVAPALGRAADAVWAARFDVGELACSSVVLAVDARHWEFVGPATWTAARGRLGEEHETPKRARWAERDAGADTPELAVRRWCADRDTVPVTRQPALAVDEETGAVLMGGRPAVPGLYAAHAPHRADAAPPDAHAVMAAGRRAALSAVSEIDARHGPGIRAVG
ncbi:hypothetical protein [Actinocorallia sp. API 0066]|uniref:hypothetical protein n=1 Tax=Actinocorallia sp. API 0066 TaxID=2896846 RepID=UPI00271457E3|nr:hypothetical protein [Actinocorallia sp. API 0066]